MRLPTRIRFAESTKDLTMSPSASERTSGNGGRGPVRAAVALSASVVLSGMLTSAVIAGPVQATEETPVPDGPAPSVPVTDPSDVPVPEPSQPAESTEISESQARADEYWLDEYGVRDAWKASRGEGATIAIIDTGVGAPTAFGGAQQLVGGLR